MEPDERSKYRTIPVSSKYLSTRILKKYNGEKWAYNEGCLSIPKIREDIVRHELVILRYRDENFEFHRKTFHGITARIIYMNMIILRGNFSLILASAQKKVDERQA
jgi:peptide deformylase